MRKASRSKQKLNQNLGQIIRQARNDAGLTQAQVAERVQIEAKYLSGIENGHGIPSFEKLSRLIAVLKIDPRLIFDTSISIKPKSELTKIMDLLSDLDEAELRKIRSVIASLVHSLDISPKK